jgi:hypothetical protein
MTTEDDLCFCKEGCTLMRAHDVCRIPVIPADKLSEFWRGIYPDGMEMQDVLDELLDLETVAKNVSLVYDHVTGGKVSKPNTLAAEVIAMADGHINDLIDEALEEEGKYGDD